MLFTQPKFLHSWGRWQAVEGRGAHVIEKLETILQEVGNLHSKLVLLVGGTAPAQRELLQAVATKHGVVPFNVGMELGKRLAQIPKKRRPLLATDLFRQLAERSAKGDLLLVKNIELLFDRSLRLDPLDVLKQHARYRRVLAVWPGALQEGRLVYAQMGHPEYQEYGAEGAVPFEIQ